MEQQPGKKFQLQWTLATALGYGLSIGLGFTLIDSIQAIIFGMLLAGLLVSLIQWAVLFQIVRGASDWIWMGWSIFLLLVGVLAFNSPLHFIIFTFVLIILSYPLSLSLGQWSILRRFVKRSWWWLGISSLAIIIGLIINFLAVVALQNLLQNVYMAAISGASLGGAVQGYISGAGLVWLFKERKVQAKAEAKAEPKANSWGYEKPPNEKQWLIIQLCLTPIIIVWEVLHFHLLSSNLPLPYGLLFFTLFFLFYFNFSILIHELGHLVLALISGSKLKFIAVRKLLLLQTDKGLRFRWLRRISAGGLTSAVPSSPISLKRKFIITVIGGPLASFLLFSIGPILLLFPDIVRENFFLQLVVVFSGFNLYSAILNSLPLKIGYHLTDGYLISMLVRNTPQGQRFMALYKHLAYLAQGVRPRDIETELVERAIALPDKSIHHLSGLLIAYYQELDNDNLEQAGSYLNQALELKQVSPELFRSGLLLEAAYFEALVRKSFTVAQEWFNEVKELALIEPHTLLRVESALLLAKGNPVAAVEKAHGGLREIPQESLEKGMAVAEEDWLKRIIREAK